MYQILAHITGQHTSGESGSGNVAWQRASMLRATIKTEMDLREKVKRSSREFARNKQTTIDIYTNIKVRR